jgi:hypothetical protein
VKYLVYGSQQLSRLIERHLTLDLEVGLEIRHQKSGGDSFAGHVARHKPETPFAKIQEIEIIPSDLASLDARTRVFECSNGRRDLREKPCLDLSGNFEFLCGAAFRFLLPGHHAPLKFNLPGHFIEPNQRE